MINGISNAADTANTEEERLVALNEQAWEWRRFYPDKAKLLAEEALLLGRKLMQEGASTAVQQEVARSLLILSVVEARASNFNKALVKGTESRRIFEEIGNTTGEVYALTTLAKIHLSLGELEQAAELINKTLAIPIDDPEARGTALSAAGQHQWSIGNYPGALDYFLQSRTVLQQAPSVSELLSVLNNLGIVYAMLGDHDKGLEYSNIALLLSREHGDKISESAAVLNIGTLYRRQHDNAKAREYFLMTFRINESIDNKMGQMHALTNLASLEFDEHNDALSERYTMEGLQLARAVGEHRIESFMLVSLGQLCGRRGQRDKAQAYFLESLELRRAIQHHLGEIDALTALASLESDAHLYDEALLYLHEALAIAEKLKAKAGIFEIHSQLADVYEAKGEFAQALQHHRKFYELQKVFFSEQALVRQKSLQVFYETEQAAREMEIYKLRNEELAAANAEITRQKRNIEEYAETIRKAHDQLLDKSIALEHMNRDKDEFIGIAVHGLKNPLSLIIMAASMLRMNSGRMDKEELDKNLEWIELAAWRMEDLVLKLLQSNAIESGGMDVATEVIDLESILLPVLQEYYRRAKAKHIQIEVEGLNPEARVRADASMTRDILDNLISNAVKFSPSHTTIYIRIVSVAEAEAGRLCVPALRVLVQDEGPGLTPDDQKRLFGKFERLSAKPTGGEHSTGLGLSIAKKMTEMMGGAIWCESAPGQGAVFAVELPAA